MASTQQAAVAAGVDGSALGLRAARWAAGEAALRGAGLVLVAVDTGAVTGTTVGGPVPASVHEAARADHEHALAAAVDEVRDTAAAVEVETQLRVGNPAAELIALSRSAQLVVVGTRGHGEITGLLVGSVAQALVGHAHGSVLVVGRNDAPDSVREGGVVVGVDGSAHGECALREGFAEASARRTALKAIHSGHDRRRGSRGAQRSSAGELFLTEHLAPWRKLHPDVAVQEFVDDGPAARSLAGHCSDARMIVVGSRGHGGFTGLLLGSVSHALLHTAQCPLMVAR